MNFYTKFRVGEEVYVVYKEDGFIEIWRDKIISITIRENNVVDYILDKLCDTFSGHELVKFDDKKGLINKIDELIEKGKEELNESI